MIVMLVTEREPQVTAPAGHLLMGVQLYRFGVRTVFGTSTGLFYMLFFSSGSCVHTTSVPHCSNADGFLQGWAGCQIYARLMLTESVYCK